MGGDHPSDLVCAHNFMQLTGLLSDTFTVIVPDRRGRGASPRPYRPDHEVRREVDDLAALVRAAGAARVFGLSSRALIGLAAARAMGAIDRLAAYEPPLFLEDAPIEMRARLEREVGEGRLAAALITGKPGES